MRPWQSDQQQVTPFNGIAERLEKEADLEDGDGEKTEEKSDSFRKVDGQFVCESRISLEASEAKKDGEYMEVEGPQVYFGGTSGVKSNKGDSESGQLMSISQQSSD